MRTIVRTRVARLWILAALAAVAMASAQAGPETGEKEKAATLSVPVGNGGLQVAIDPATGKLRTPTPAEARQLAAALGLMLKDTSEDLERVVWPDGTTVVDLQGRFMSVAVAAVDDDGTLVTECVTDPDVATVLMADAAVAAPGQEE